ncbi:MAG: flagellar hook protein FlgE [Acidobacteria bacterium]|nr:flagellar hook protein FlgE [Acidobacteriota bacterium]
MAGSFSTALSGLNAESQAINVVGNNLANLNTVGYKNSTVSFADMMAQASGGSRSQTAGGGVGAVYTSRNFSQGAIQVTNGAFDAAIEGDGFFVLQNSDGEKLYSRAGNFTVDNNGYLVTNGGEQVLGWNRAGGTLNARPLALMSGGNAAGTAAAGTNSFTAPVDTIDSLGAHHSLTIKFTKSDTNTWDYEVTIPNEDLGIKSTDSTTTTSLAKDKLVFNADGTLKTPAADDTGAGVISLKPPSGSSTFSSGGTFSEIKWSLYSPEGKSQISQFATTSSISSVTQDGAAPSTLTRVSLGDDGMVIAHYSNGKDINIAHLAVAAVRNPESRIAVGNNNFSLAGDTIALPEGPSGSEGRGTVRAGALEASTVDVAQEFTNLMVYQRGYQANSKVITTLDELTQDTLSMKR